MRASCLAFCKRRPRGTSIEEKHFGCEGTGAKGQPPQAVAAAQGRLRRRRSSPMHSGIAFVAAPCIRPHGARNAASHPFSAACYDDLGPLQNADRDRREAEEKD